MAQGAVAAILLQKHCLYFDFFDPAAVLEKHAAEGFQREIAKPFGRAERRETDETEVESSWSNAMNFCRFLGLDATRKTNHS